MDEILVTNYDDVENGLTIDLHKKYPRYVQFRNYRELDLKNRAGSIFEKSTDKVSQPCLRPSAQLVINWKGNVLLCCNDYYERHIFGNVNNKSILEIWRDKNFIKYREILSQSDGRKQINFCKKCDM